MKGLFSLTFAATLVATACAYAQPDNSPEGSQASPAQDQGVAKIAGKKFYAVDGSIMTLVAFDGGVAREIDSPGGVVHVKMFALNGSAAGKVTDGGDNGDAPGTFTLTDAGIAAVYADGSTETLALNEDGGVSLASNSPENGLICTAWYPEGHRFSSAERRAAVMQASGSFSVSAAADSCSTGKSATREARVTPRHSGRRVAANPTPLETAMAATGLRGSTVEDVPVSLEVIDR